MLIDLPAAWRDRAAELEPYAGPAAEAFRRAADELDAALREAADEELTLQEAAEESGYSTRRLRELLSEGEVPMGPSGRKGRPRIRRADLPRKPGSTRGPADYDPTTDAAEILESIS